MARPVPYRRDNWSLSAMQARSVLLFLVRPVRQGGGGLDPHLWSVAGYASDDPVATNDTDEGRQKNRRIELVAVPGPGDTPNLDTLAQ